MANYQQVLRTVTYDNTAEAPNPSVRLIDFVANDGTGDSQIARTTLAFTAVAESLWVSTDGDVASPSGAPGLDSWTDAEALKFGSPGFALEPGVTSGSFSSVFNIDDFTAGRDLRAMHFVTRDLTVGGANSLELQAGDLLLALDANATLTSTNSLAVAAEFRNA